METCASTLPCTEYHVGKSPTWAVAGRFPELSICTHLFGFWHSSASSSVVCSSAHTDILGWEMEVMSCLCLCIVCFVCFLGVIGLRWDPVGHVWAQRLGPQQAEVSYQVKCHQLWSPASCGHKFCAFQYFWEYERSLLRCVRRMNSEGVCHNLVIYRLLFIHHCTHINHKS